MRSSVVAVMAHEAVHAPLTNILPLGNPTLRGIQEGQGPVKVGGSALEDTVRVATHVQELFAVFTALLPELSDVL